MKVVNLKNENIKLTCKMKKLAQPPQLAMSMMVPVTQCCSEAASVAAEESWWEWWPLPWRKSRIGPLYSVITIAPVTVIAVPITFATLCIFLTFTVSSLYINITLSTAH